MSVQKIRSQSKLLQITPKFHSLLFGIQRTQKYFLQNLGNAVAIFRLNLRKFISQTSSKLEAGSPKPLHEISSNYVDLLPMIKQNNIKGVLIWLVCLTSKNLDIPKNTCFGVFLQISLSNFLEKTRWRYSLFRLFFRSCGMHPRRIKKNSWSGFGDPTSIPTQGPH